MSVDLPQDLSTAQFLITEQILAIQRKDAELAARTRRIGELEHQVAWFKKQIFGRKSERVIPAAATGQLTLGHEISGGKRTALNLPKTKVAEHERRKSNKQPLEGDCGESGLRFDGTIRVEEIPVPVPEIAGLEEGKDYEVLEVRVSERMAQEKGAYYIKRWMQPKIKLIEKNVIVAPPAPEAVLEGTYADVSVLVGIILDKFMYHLPLYRIHQRMTACGVRISRGTLTNWVMRVADLLEPIGTAQFDSVLESKNLAMDETPSKVGLDKPGKMHRGYFWPIFGDKNEITFHYAATRARKVIEEVLKGFTGTLLTDGYSAYESYTARVQGVEHAQCWSHTRRTFVEAQGSEPERVEKALAYIRKLYAIEDEIKERKLEPEKIQEYRAQHSKPVVDELFTWLEEDFTANALLPSDLYTKAANYALQREKGLRVFLTNPDIPLDTNHLERALRVLPMGRKAWLFSWSEVGAEAVATIQSLICSCKLQGVDPHEYLTDVLQRIGTHPAAEVRQLIPRLWKERFAKKNKAESG